MVVRVILLKFAVPITCSELKAITARMHEVPMSGPVRSFISVMALMRNQNTLFRSDLIDDAHSSILWSRVVSVGIRGRILQSVGGQLITMRAIHVYYSSIVLVLVIQ